MRRVLVVDDEPLVADTLTAIFRKNGFEVRTAYSADTGIEVARDFTPELLLCDIDMPIRDGLELMSDVSSELPACRIVVLTGLYGSVKRIRERTAAFLRPVSVLTKPCQPVELLREVSLVLASA